MPKKLNKQQRVLLVVGAFASLLLVGSLTGATVASGAASPDGLESVVAQETGEINEMRAKAEASDVGADVFRAESETLGHCIVVADTEQSSGSVCSAPGSRDVLVNYTMSEHGEVTIAVLDPQQRSLEIESEVNFDRVTSLDTGLEFFIAKSKTVPARLVVADGDRTLVDDSATLASLVEASKPLSDEQKSKGHG